MGRDKIAANFSKEKLGKNPFEDSLLILASNVSEDKILHETKDMTENFLVNVSETRKFNWVLERQSYVKLFRSPDTRKRIASLKGNSNKLLFWIMQEILAPNDYLTINIDRCKEECGINHNTYCSCIEELVHAGFIARTYHKKVYWINPQIFFSGNRIKKYKDNVVVS